MADGSIVYHLILIVSYLLGIGILGGYIPRIARDKGFQAFKSNNPKLIRLGIIIFSILLLIKIIRLLMS